VFCVAATQHFLISLKCGMMLLQRSHWQRSAKELLLHPAAYTLLLCLSSAAVQHWELLNWFLLFQAVDDGICCKGLFNCGTVR
jgi:hypothetical protein